MPEHIKGNPENKKEITVAELFAGVGGFRLGLEKSNYKVIWSNQWEPSTKAQHASWVYASRFGNENHSNQDIESILTADIPDHNLLVGGFPCQDYSVATSLNNSKGLIGKKGVLWWSIHRILEEKANKPKFLMLENVDRLLKSPAKQRGRDFAVMLKSLDNLGYAVEWRVINAAEYGMPQRRKRIFILGYHKSTDIYKELLIADKNKWLSDIGTISKSFPVQAIDGFDHFNLSDDLVHITNNFNCDKKISPFNNTGIMINSNVYTAKTIPNYSGHTMTLGDILQNGEAAKELYIDEKHLDKWNYLKGPKKIERHTKDGFVYNYSEGGMIYPDALDKPSRTIITGEGGKSPSRFKHVISTNKGLRRLSPLELERLNMFPDNHTKLEGISDSKRAFFMGNALVVGVVEKLGLALQEQIASCKHFQDIDQI